MFRSSRLQVFSLGIVVLLAVGCGGAATTTNGDAPSDGATATPEQQKEIEAALAQLSAEDRAAAEKQRICPVSGAPLGSMDKPPKVDINGREVFLCCSGCESTLREEPEKYLAKLPAE